MKLLVVKLSSLGDVVHTFPAVTDALRAVPGLTVDWAVEEAFVPLVRLHPGVRRVIPVPLRRLLKAPMRAANRAEFARIRRELTAEHYDVVIDAQGLAKSAAVALFASGRRHGFDRSSAREGIASFAYGTTHAVPETEHMATRLRKLFAAALGYRLETLPEAAGLPRSAESSGETPHIVLLHGTTWPTKTWSLEGWRRLAAQAGADGFRVLLFAHGAVEEARAAAISEGIACVERVPPGGLDRIAPRIAGAAGVVSVDTGLGHLAAAYGVPTVGLYGPTNPVLTGLFGPRVREIAATRSCAPCEKETCRIAPQMTEGPPCLADVSPETAWRALRALMAG